MATPEPENPTGNAERPGPVQTIVIERRERAGLLRRIVVPTLVVLFLLFLVANSLTHEGVLPTRLTERYAAGETSGPTIAIVEVNGMILESEVEFALRQIRQARDDDRVKAVVLRIDS